MQNAAFCGARADWRDLHLSVHGGLLGSRGGARLPDKLLRLGGKRTTTFALRATIRSTASTAPVSSAGGPDHGGSSGNLRGADSSGRQGLEKHDPKRYAARQQTAQMPV